MPRKLFQGTPSLSHEQVAANNNHLAVVRVLVFTRDFWTSFTSRVSHGEERQGPYGHEARAWIAVRAFFL